MGHQIHPQQILLEHQQYTAHNHKEHAMTSYNLDLLPLLTSVVFLTIVVLWIAVKNYKNFIITFLIIPLTLVAAIVSYSTVDRLLGYPVHGAIDKDSLYLFHVESGDREWIYVWVIAPDDLGEVRPRAITIANTEQNRKAMQEAQEKGEQGQPMSIGQEGQMELGNNGETNGGEYEVYDFQINHSPDLKN